MDQLLEEIHQIEDKLEEIKKEAVQDGKNYKRLSAMRQKLEQEIAILKKLRPVKFREELQAQKNEDPIGYGTILLQRFIKETERETEKYYQQNSFHNTAAELLEQYKSIFKTPKTDIVFLGKQFCYDIKQTEIYHDLVIPPTLQDYFLSNQWDQKFASRVLKIYRMVEHYQNQKLSAIQNSHRELRVQNEMKATIYNLLDDPSQLLGRYLNMIEKDLYKNNPDSFQLYTCFKQNDFLKKVFGVSFDPQVIETSTLGKKLFETLALWEISSPTTKQKKQLVDHMAYLKSQAITSVEFTTTFFRNLQTLDKLVHHKDQIPSEFLALNITQKQILYHLFKQAKPSPKIKPLRLAQDESLQLNSYSQLEQITYQIKRYKQQVFSTPKETLISLWEEVMQSNQNVSYKLFKMHTLKDQPPYDLGTYQYQDQEAKLWLCDYRYFVPITASGRMIHDCCTKLDEPLDEQEQLCMYYSKSQQASCTPSEMFASIMDVRRLIKQYGEENTLIYYQSQNEENEQEKRIRMIVDPGNTKDIELPLFQEYLIDRKQRELTSTPPKGAEKSLDATLQAIHDHQQPIFKKQLKK